MNIELKHTEKAREIARILDSAFRVPGTNYRFGLDPILGLVPGLGDVVGGGFSFYLLLLAYRAGAPPVVILRMFGNIAVDLLFGAIPFLGDLMDAGFKANIRNLELVERYLVQPTKTRKRSRALLVGFVLLLIALFAGGIAITFLVIRGMLNLLGA